MKYLVMLGLLAWSSFAFSKPLIIAHRGASGYLPEHTLPAVAMAYGLGADFIEQDVVLTKDDVAVVLHDPYLDTVTDVAAKFPARVRKDGRFYAIDFDLAEIKTLSVKDRFDRKTGLPVFSKRFPHNGLVLRVPTLEEELLLIKGLNAAAGKNVGIYVEMKSPALHRSLGHDIVGITLKVLADHGYSKKTDNGFIQCFDDEILKEIKAKKLTGLRLVQLIGENSWGEAKTDFTAMQSEAGIKKVAAYADGIGPWIPQILLGRDAKNGQYQLSSLVNWAHSEGMVVHPYTFRKDSLPKGVGDFPELVRLFAEVVKVDGMFTDFADIEELIE